MPIWLFSAGALAVFFYRRITGQQLSAFAGAHLGWISGLMGFLLMGPLIAFSLPQQMRQPDFVSKMRASMQSMGAADQIDQTIAMLRSPSGIIVMLVVFFLIYTALPAVGGALGAKLFSAGSNAGGEPRQPSA
jgi:hypothetical protein